MMNYVERIERLTKTRAHRIFISYEQEKPAAHLEKMHAPKPRTANGSVCSESSVEERIVVVIFVFIPILRCRSGDGDNIARKQTAKGFSQRIKEE